MFRVTMERKLKAAEPYNVQFLGVVKQMMFVQGDTEDSIDRCQDFVLDLVKCELIKVLEKSYVYTTANKRKTIFLEDILFQFRRHPIMLGRLLKFAKSASAIRNISVDAEPDADVANSDTDSDSDGNDDVAAASKRMFGSIDDELCKVVDSFNLDMSATQMQDMVDTVLDQRKLRMASVVKRMKPFEYERFTEARRVTFNPPAKRKKKKRTGKKAPKNSEVVCEDTALTVWLGCPPLAKHVDFVLGFIARETVALIVEDALTVRMQEAKGYFTDEGTKGSLQLRHYEEALRRNVGFRRNGDFLFGFY